MIQGFAGSGVHGVCGVCSWAWMQFCNLGFDLGFGCLISNLSWVGATLQQVFYRCPFYQAD